MTPNQRFTLLTMLLSVLITGVGFVIKLLWTASSRWQQTTDTLQYIKDEIRDVISTKEKEHDKIYAKLNQHEQWLYGQRDRRRNP